MSRRSKVSAARSAARRLVGERRRRDGRMRDLLRGSDAMAGLDARDRALASRLALGVTATSGALDAMIDSHLRRRAKLEPRVRDALQVASYELCWMETPPEVAVSQGVELVREASPRAAGLANAVLHRVAEEDAPRVRAAVARLRAGASDDVVADAALATGMSAWLAAAVSGSIGDDGLRDMALSQLEPAPVWVVANVARLTEAGFLERCGEVGLHVEPVDLPGSWRVDNPARLALSGLVRDAEAFPADLAAQVVARIAAPEAGERMLEVGQGRGTKTALLQLAAMEAGRPADIVGVDSEAGKVELARRRLERAGLDEHVRSVALDGRVLAGVATDELVGRDFDVVLLDAPCSGTGTMRRHPEIAWVLDPAAVDPANPDGLPALQLALLRAAATRVRQGGTLVYATCSVLASEDEHVVQAFLASDEGRGFHIAPIADAPGVTCLPEAARQLITNRLTSDGFFRSTPRERSFDGHFCARLMRG